MRALVLGLFMLVALLWLMTRFSRANPATMSRNVTMAGGVAALLVAALLTLRGGAVLAAPLAAFGAWLLGWGRGILGGPGGSTSSTPGQYSEVTTDHLEMQIDHDTGTMRGRVIKGMFENRSIESLRPVELAHLWADCRFVDPQSARILEAYLDRVHPEWREDMARGEAEMSEGPDGKMRRAEALDILGLEEGASDDDIRQAHRDLMKKMHPDRGGSTYLASKINEAKDVLLEQA